MMRTVNTHECILYCVPVISRSLLKVVFLASFYILKLAENLFGNLADNFDRDD